MRIRRGGYTLLEVTVALAIGGLVATSLTGLVGRSVRARSILTARTATLGDVRTAAFLLAADLEQARPGSLRIARLHPGATPVIALERIAPDPLLVRWVLTDGTLMRELRHRFAPASALRTTSVLAAVRHLDARARADGRWHASWDGPRAPRAVAFTVAAADLGELALTVTPHVPGGT